MEFLGPRCVHKKINKISKTKKNNKKEYFPNVYFSWKLKAAHTFFHANHSRFIRLL